MPSPDIDAAVIRRTSRRVLWLVLAVCAAPLLASYAAFHFWTPSSHVNYGDLLEPRQLPDTELATLEGKPFRLSELRGRWVLVTPSASSCDAACRTKLVYMRQVRLAQGKETGRIERVWLMTDAGAPDSALLPEHPGLHLVRGADIAAQLPAPRSSAEHIYIIDPLGNLMMRFPADPDPRRMLKDLSRLLRHSKWK